MHHFGQGDACSRGVYEAEVTNDTAKELPATTPEETRAETSAGRQAGITWKR
jgi:hypothetical protein